jgi:hypothetical protein
MSRIMSTAARGAVAGAAGTTVLNAVTYLDMALRGREASSTPERSVERMARLAGAEIPGHGEIRKNRTSGLGALLGIATGVGVGSAAGALVANRAHRIPWAVLSALLGTAAMAAGNVPMVRLGVTDPRRWSGAAWASDVLPHVAYGATVAAALRALDN